VQACAQVGITFVGPSPATLELCGDKVRALAEEQHIYVLHGTNAGADHAALEALLDDTGAVMPNARAGGGRRGTRVVRRGDDVASIGYDRD
jgi:pyruvate carboxylase